MDRRNFTDTKLGQIVEIDNGSDYAFLPDPLPSNWQPANDIIPLWVAARDAIGELRGISRTLEDPAILIRPLRRREAMRSSSLEGTYADPNELLFYEMDVDDRSRFYSNNDLREVFNYQAALEYGTQLLKEEYPLSEWLIRQLHEQLLNSVRGAEMNPGQVRVSQVHIGSGKRFTPPPPEHVPPLMGALEKSLNSSPPIDPLIWSLMVHYQFETIHPFRDGNGRIGRLLLALMISKGCGFEMPWLYLSEYFDQNKDEYIDALYGVSVRGDWETWIRLGLNATIETCKSTISRIEKLLEIKKEYEQKIRQMNGRDRLMYLVPQFLSSPIVTYKKVQEICETSYVTARADVDALIEQGILAPLPTFTNPKRFVAMQVYSVALFE